MKFYNNISKFGFTLAEMLVVMSILSILTAAALPVISKREYTSHSLEAGSIVAWDKTYVPDGFHICDGDAGTPDLRQYFVRATGSSGPALNSTGGSTSIDFTNGGTVDPANYLPIHSHTMQFLGTTGGLHTHNITISPVTHTHTITFNSEAGHVHTHPLFYLDNSGPYYSANATLGGYQLGVASGTGIDGYESGHVHTVTVASAPDHNHSLTDKGSSPHTHPGSHLTSQGSNTWDTPKPPYYALYYIMKMY